MKISFSENLNQFIVCRICFVVDRYFKVLRQACGKFSWCKGIRISTGGSCRLLAKDQPAPLSGWSPYDFGNWAEPDQWKNSAVSGYTCHAKDEEGVYPIMRV